MSWITLWNSVGLFRYWHFLGPFLNKMNEKTKVMQKKSPKMNFPLIFCILVHKPKWSKFNLTYKDTFSSIDMCIFTQIFQISFEKFHLIFTLNPHSRLLEKFLLILKSKFLHMRIWRIQIPANILSPSNAKHVLFQIVNFRYDGP